MDQTRILREFFSGPCPFVIQPAQASQLTSKLACQPEQLGPILAESIKEQANPEISGFQVGAALTVSSGAIYLGVNLEFPGLLLRESVHAEQFVTVLALENGANTFVRLDVTAVPCGHCRQWLRELPGSLDLLVQAPGVSGVTLRQLLPHSFGPGELGAEGGLVLPGRSIGQPYESSPMDAARQAYASSYAPYTKAKAGVGLGFRGGRTIQGSYLENVAFNPSINPMTAALICARAERLLLSDLTEAVLCCERDSVVDFVEGSRQLLATGSQVPLVVCEPI